MAIDMAKILGVDDLKDWKKLLKCILCEFLGTMMLVLVGCGSALNWKTSFDVTQISLAFGLVVMAMATVTGNVSGGNLNPAVSVGLMVGGHLSILKGLIYIVIQIVGAICGVGVLKAATPEGQQDNFGANGLQSEEWRATTEIPVVGVDVPVGGAFMLEALLTMMLVLVVYASAVDEKTKAAPGVAPLLIGLTVAAAHLVCITYTGTSINPARSIASAVFDPKSAASGSRKYLWLFIIAPIFGGAVGGGLYQYILHDSTDTKKASSSTELTDIKE